MLGQQPSPTGGRGPDEPTPRQIWGFYRTRSETIEDAGSSTACHEGQLSSLGDSPQHLLAPGTTGILLLRSQKSPGQGHSMGSCQPIPHPLWASSHLG